MRHRKLIIPLLLILSLPLFCKQERPLTVPEESLYKRTSTSEEVMAFLQNLQKRDPKRMKLTLLTYSTERERIPLVIFSRQGVCSPEEMRKLGLRAVLIAANIHAGEVEGKEASLIFLRELAEAPDSQFLEGQVLLFLPLFNRDGNDKWGVERRRDDGPESAGVRFNGQGLDLNRDFVKLESPEVGALVERIFVPWDPILYIDMHTTNGSYHRHPVTYSPQVIPQGDKSLQEYMWKKMLPEVAGEMRREGIDAVPYGNFLDRRDPEKGWLNEAFLGRYSNNYYGLRNRFALLDENYSYAPFEVRIRGAHALLKALLGYTARHGDEMERAARRADRESMESLAGREFGLLFEPEETMKFDLKSFPFRLEEDKSVQPSRFRMVKQEGERVYHLPLFATYKAVKSTRLPGEGYLLPPSQEPAARLLKRHGVAVERLEEGGVWRVRTLRLTGVTPSSQLYQGHYINKIEGEEEEKEISFPKGSFFVPLAQPLSRLAAYMLEPLNPDGLGAWNFFDRVLVKEWEGLWIYPVYKVDVPVVGLREPL